MSAIKTIIGRQLGNPIEDEYTAGGTITPGMLLLENSSGAVIAHNLAGQNAEKKFALEDVNQGRGVDDDYDATTYKKVRVGTFRPGDKVYAILADGETVVIGDYGESNGDGCLKKHVADTADSDDSITVYPNQIVCKFKEAKDLSGSSGAESEDSGTGYNKRVLVEIV